MILPGFYLRSRTNQVWEQTGIDSLAYAKDVDYFKNYPHSISYNYNSRGFRDAEWPDTGLQDAVWCIGDSFTVGLGAPINHAWPKVLESTINNRTINVSMDGASNMWIARKAIELIQTVAPKNIVILWSYFHRREKENNENDYPDELRRLWGLKDATHQDDYANFVKCITDVSNLQSSTNIIHSIVPNAVKWSGSESHKITTTNFGDIHQYQAHLKTTWDNIKGESWPGECPNSVDELESLDAGIIDEIKNVYQVYDDIESTVFYIEQTRKLPMKNNLGEIKQLDYGRDAHHFDLLTSQRFVDQIVPLLRVDRF